MKLTDTFIRRVNGKMQKHSYGGGLFLYVTPTGKKSWRMAYRFAGKQKLLTINPSCAKREAKAQVAEAAHRQYTFGGGAPFRNPFSDYDTLVSASVRADIPLCRHYWQGRA